jgi:hypothetical protein
MDNNNPHSLVEPDDYCSLYRECALFVNDVFLILL